MEIDELNNLLNQLEGEYKKLEQLKLENEAKIS